MKNITLILTLIVSAFFCNAQEIEYLQLNNKSTNTTIAECDSVSNLQYYQKGDKINLSWDVPGQLGLSHSDDSLANAIGAGLNITVAHKFEPEDLIDYVGYSVIKISFIPIEERCLYTVKVWKETNGVLEIVTSQPAEHFVIREYNTATLLNPVVIEDSTTYYFGYYSTNCSFPAGVDAGPAIVGKGNLVLNVYGVWESLTNIAPNMNWNFCIKAHIAPSSGDSAPTGFNVLRNDTLLKYTPISAYTDENIYFGQQEYCIEAVYNNCTSEKNCILVDVGYSSVGTQKSEFSIYPNPTSDYLKISGINTNEIEEVAVYNLLGKKVASHENTDLINVSTLPKSTYLLKIRCGKQVYSKLFVVN
ncbi:MAG: T9SS type A sorting domain-containing protein [Bacteroidales bacterium]